MASDFDKVVAAAAKAAGSDLKMPSTPSSIMKAGREIGARKAAYDAAVEKLQECIRSLHASVFDLAKEENAWAGLVEKSDLGLDAKGADFKKQRAAAQKVLDGFFAEQQKALVDNGKAITELSKHLGNLFDYESPQVPK